MLKHFRFSPVNFSTRSSCVALIAFSWWTDEFLDPGFTGLDMDKTYLFRGYLAILLGTGSVFSRTTLLGTHITMSLF